MVDHKREEAGNGDLRSASSAVGAGDLGLDMGGNGVAALALTPPPYDDVMGQETSLTAGADASIVDMGSPETGADRAAGGRPMRATLPIAALAAPNSQLVGRIAELEAALQPFADEAASYDPDTGDSDEIVWATPTSFKIRDLRRAREVLTTKEASE